MDIEKFIEEIPYLYHLTDPINLDSILSDYTLKSTTTLATLFELPEEEFPLRIRRVGHKQPIFSKGNYKFCPRDQDPLVEKRLMLEEGMDAGDFIHLLNSKVFFWAQKTNLESHYGRYKKLGQKPCILRVSTADLFLINSVPPMFCSFNSGMTNHWTRGLPVRGKSSFKLADNYSGKPNSVKEVTFEEYCKLPETLYLTKDLAIPFERI